MVAGLAGQAGQLLRLVQEGMGGMPLGNGVTGHAGGGNGDHSASDVSAPAPGQLEPPANPE